MQTPPAVFQKPPLQACPASASQTSIFEECLARHFFRSVPKGCLRRMSIGCTSLKECFRKCRARVLEKRAHRCHTIVSNKGLCHKSVLKGPLQAVLPKMVSKECIATVCYLSLFRVRQKVSCMGACQDCPTSVFQGSVAQWRLTRASYKVFCKSARQIALHPTSTGVFQERLTNCTL